MRTGTGQALGMPQASYATPGCGAAVVKADATDGLLGSLRHTARGATRRSGCSAGPSSVPAGVPEFRLRAVDGAPAVRR